jgi:hypothetical protein
METALNRWLPWRRPEPEPVASATARFGGERDEEPVLVASIQGPVEIEMARDALAEAEIPAYIKTNQIGRIYGLTIGSFGVAEVWVMPPFAEKARDVLIGIGLLAEPDAREQYEEE